MVSSECWLLGTVLGMEVLVRDLEVLQVKEGNGVCGVC